MAATERGRTSGSREGGARDPSKATGGCGHGWSMSGCGQGWSTSGWLGVEHDWVGVVRGGVRVGG